MAEENQEQNAQQNAQQSAQQNVQRNEQNQEQRTEETNAQDTEPKIPKHRFDQVNQRAKDAEAKLQSLEQESEQAQEERSAKQGEYQELADKRLGKIKKLEEELKEVRSEWTRERRMNVWSRAAQGIVKQNAIADAFSFVSEDELAGIDESDESSFRALAQNLVEMRDYLAAEGPKGAGSFGSRKPVLSGPGGSSDVSGPGGRKMIFKKQRRPDWR